MDIFYNPTCNSNQQNKFYLYFLYGICIIRGFRTGHFDKYKCEPLEGHINQLFI